MLIEICVGVLVCVCVFVSFSGGGFKSHLDVNYLVAAGASIQAIALIVKVAHMPRQKYHKGMYLLLLDMHIHK